MWISYFLYFSATYRWAALWNLPPWWCGSKEMKVDPIWYWFGMSNKFANNELSYSSPTHLHTFYIQSKPQSYEILSDFLSICMHTTGFDLVCIRAERRHLFQALTIFASLNTHYYVVHMWLGSHRRILCFTHKQSSKISNEYA